MRRLTLLVFMSVFLISAFAQEAKIAPTTAGIPAAPTEKVLTKESILEYQNLSLRLEKLQKEYKVAEFQEKVKPISDEQQAWYMGLCRSIGLTDEQIAQTPTHQSECGLNVGVDVDGKPIMGQDGKPIQSRVWHVKPTEPPKVDAKK